MRHRACQGILAANMRSVTVVTAERRNQRKTFAMRTSYTTFLADTFPLPFRGRAQAGRILAGRLKAFAGQSDAVVVAIANDGVPVAAQVASALRLPMTVEVIRNLHVPGHEELAMGSIAPDDVKVLDQATMNALHIPERVADWVIFRETQELLRRERVFTGGREGPELANKTVILVDDGVAEAPRMLAAIQAVRKQGACRIVVAVPVGSKQIMGKVRAAADQVVCLFEPKLFMSLSHWYDKLEPVEDWEVCQILEGLAEPTAELTTA
jgi:predicted phosphoribosyltransferase